MNEEIKKFISANAGPLTFLMIAALLCWMLPVEKSVEAIYLVIGAALTRVKRAS